MTPFAKRMMMSAVSAPSAPPVAPEVKRRSAITCTRSTSASTSQSARSMSGSARSVKRSPARARVVRCAAKSEIGMPTLFRRSCSVASGSQWRSGFGT